MHILPRAYNCLDLNVVMCNYSCGKSMKTPLESEPHRFGRQWCLFFNPQYLCGFSGFGVPVLNWTQNWKNPKKRIRTSKMNESEPLCSIIKA